MEKSFSLIFHPLVQTCTFAPSLFPPLNLQIAATDILASVGVVPDYYMGHSLGETAAGYARGVQSAEETIQIAYVRSTLSAKIKDGGFILKTSKDRPDLPLVCASKGFRYYDLAPGAPEVASPPAGGDEALFDLTGQMVAVGLPAGEVERAIADLGLFQTCVACFNAPTGQTVSGARSEVARLKLKLLEAHPDLFWREIDTDGVAYHAPHLDCYFDYLVEEVAVCSLFFLKPFLLQKKSLSFFSLLCCEFLICWVPEWTKICLKWK